ncbi:diacylglycerol acyltransferase [Necator americanus]|uniref:diacylglycerol O-acyltransferase n=1 Tax=Necator americanus TaxID=51031 RepID=W2TD39_NECAM|nr:diacylglycerol acyltransferase [Necator americanus]ETN79960.1 diacylglycerol acyltransferase [Necator americanus]
MHKLKLASRKGFVKEALRAGASLVPVYSFGENDIYEQLNFGFLPYNRAIDVVVGAPIAVEQVAEPTNEDVDRVHEQYCDALTQLFDRYKTRFGVSKDTLLTIE